MGYFKIIKNDEVIAVTQLPVWVRQKTRGRIGRCEAKDATGVLSADESEIYHIAGTPKMDGDFEDVYVEKITKPEFETMSAVLGVGGSIVAEEFVWEIPVEASEEPYADEGLDVAMERWLSKLSADCQNAIFSGIDIVLSDGIERHFDMTLEDQLNLFVLSSMTEVEGAKIPYHASGCLCEYFSAEDFSHIVQAANYHKNFHTAYYNSLKNYVKSLSSVAEIVSVQYGDAIPEAYCSDIYLSLEEVKNA